MSTWTSRRKPCVATTPGLPSRMVRPVRLGAVSLTIASRSQEAQQLAYHDPLHGNAHRVNVTRTTSFDDHGGVMIDIVGGPCVAGGGTCDSGPIRCAKIGANQRLYTDATSNGVPLAVATNVHDEIARELDELADEFITKLDMEGRGQ